MTLRDRLQALTAPCLEVDAEIAETFGVQVTVMPLSGPHDANGLPVPKFTASLDAAVDLVEREMPEADWATHRGAGDTHKGREGYSALVYQGNACKTWHRHKLPAVALLLALLEAKGIE